MANISNINLNPTKLYSRDTTPIALQELPQQAVSTPSDKTSQLSRLVAQNVGRINLTNVTNQAAVNQVDPYLQPFQDHLETYDQTLKDQKVAIDYLLNSPQTSEADKAKYKQIEQILTTANPDDGLEYALKTSDYSGALGKLQDIFNNLKKLESGLKDASPDIKEILATSIASTREHAYMIAKMTDSKAPDWAQMTTQDFVENCKHRKNSDSAIRGMLQAAIDAGITPKKDYECMRNIYGYKTDEVDNFLIEDLTPNPPAKPKPDYQDALNDLNLDIKYTRDSIPKWQAAGVGLNACMDRIAADEDFIYLVTQLQKDNPSRRA